MAIAGTKMSMFFEFAVAYVWNRLAQDRHGFVDVAHIIVRVKNSHAFGPR